jgi:hypothetical protein
MLSYTQSINIFYPRLGEENDKVHVNATNKRVQIIIIRRHIITSAALEQDMNI